MHPSPCGLIYAHIFCSQFPALADRREALQSMKQGDRAGFGFRGISFPSTQTRNDPCGLGKGACAVRVFLLWRFAFQGRSYALQDFDLVRVEYVGGLNGTVSVAGHGQLHGEHRRLNSQAGQPGQTRCGFNLAGLKVQALLLQSSEQWFDVPALPVPLDALQGIFKTCDTVRGQQAPVYGRFMAHHAAGQFFDFNNAQFNLRRCAFVRAGGGTPNRDTPKAHFQRGWWALRLPGRAGTSKR